MRPDRKGILFVISAPSGAGKTTLCNMAHKGIEEIVLSVSHTTRKPRNGEKDGINYYFVDEKTFIEMVDKNQFIEWARVHGNLYGTSKAEIEKNLTNGKDILLDIDVQGGFQIKGHFADSVLIFILPPSMQILKERLVGRMTDSEEIISKRMQKAKEEIKELHRYDYVIVNNELNDAFEHLKAIITAERLKINRKNKTWYTKFIKD